jgi:hypothetical protein
MVAVVDILADPPMCYLIRIHLHYAMIDILVEWVGVWDVVAAA